MVDSILDSTKKLLNIQPDNTVFDTDILMHINSVFATLNQLGLGPDEGYFIEDNSATWTDYLHDDPRLNDVRLYTYLRTKILFDPPSGSYHLVISMEERIKEIEWRLNVKREGESWVAPQPTVPVDPEVIIIPVYDAWISE